MKNKILTFLSSVTIVIGLLMTMSSQAKAQNCINSKVFNTKVFNIGTLENKWDEYSKDKGFASLVEKVKAQGFTRLSKNEKTAWGFNASFISDTSLGTSEQEAEVCTFDFYKKTASGVQMCSMVWRKVGGTIYKSFILFPENESSFIKAMDNAKEYYIDENYKIQLAHSFGKCWSRCVFKRFNATNCAAAMATCGAASAGLIALGIGVTTPIALGIFGSCAGVFCLAPLAICAAYCL